MRVMSLTGRPTADRTITMVTRPACGTPAAPIDAAVAVILKIDNTLSVNKTTYVTTIVVGFGWVFMFDDWLDEPTNHWL